MWWQFSRACGIIGSGKTTWQLIYMKKLLILIVGLGAVFVTSCGVYKIDVQQGNILEREAIDKLELGMTMRQVRFILGTPSITDPFHTNRWDYIYILYGGSGELEQTSLTLDFDGEKLAKITHGPGSKASSSKKKAHPGASRTTSPGPAPIDQDLPNRDLGY